MWVQSRGEGKGEMYCDARNKWLSPCKVGGEALRNLCLNMTMNLRRNCRLETMQIKCRLVLCVNFLTVLVEQQTWNYRANKKNHLSKKKVEVCSSLSIERQTFAVTLTHANKLKFPFCNYGSLVWTIQLPDSTFSKQITQRIRLTRAMSHFGVWMLLHLADLGQLKSFFYQSRVRTSPTSQLAE